MDTIQSDETSFQGINFVLRVLIEDYSTWKSSKVANTPTQCISSNTPNNAVIIRDQIWPPSQNHNTYVPFFRVELETCINANSLEGH